MKIKTKKQFTLPQLIEWAMKNDMHEKSFCGDRYGDAVHFDENEDMLCDHVSLTETFTVEVEEEITEDTKIPQIIGVLQHIISNGKVVGMHYDKSVNEIIKGNYNNDSEYETSTLHILNDDGTHTLIWRDGKLI